MNNIKFLKFLIVIINNFIFKLFILKEMFRAYKFISVIRPSYLSHFNKNFNNNSHKILSFTNKNYFKKSNNLLAAKKDYYSMFSYLINLETLGISQGADQSEIKKSYFKLAKEWHPDVNKSSNAKEKFSEISE